MPAESALIEKLRAALDHAEEIARGASPGPWRMAIVFGTVFSDEAGHTVSQSRHLADADFIAAHDPAHVLRTVAAHRKIIDAWCAADHVAGFRMDDCTHDSADTGAADGLKIAVEALAAVYFPEAPDA